MAKKVRKRPEEVEAPKFEFPAFDEESFAKKEYELTGATALAGIITVLLGILGWVLTGAGMTGWLPFGLGLVIIALSPMLIGRLRSNSNLYTRGDWAGLIVLEFFGWLALWFVLLNVSPTA